MPPKNTDIRSPICSVLGHVDHGKSSILDSIRGTAIINSEAGAITQAIGASIIPIETVFNISGSLLAPMKDKIRIPGLLFIDTPGHAAFTNLRKRGGNLADIAILVVDVNEGLKPQTIEAIEILKQYKTPFVIAANKMDLVHGYKDVNETSFLKNEAKQSSDYKQNLDIKMYELIGKLQEQGLNPERFDRISDYTKNVAIIPTSAKQRIGIPELLMVLIGITQRYLESELEIKSDDNGRGIILEVKDDKGLGKTLDVIVHDGTIKNDDTLLIATPDGVIERKIRALLEPAPLSEMRDKKAQYKHVKKVVAAIGVKISVPDIDDVIAGMPVISISKSRAEEKKELSEELHSEVSEIYIETSPDGIIIKADTIGSLEALGKMLADSEVMIKRASIGDISKKDISEAFALSKEERSFGAILGFNVKASEEMKREAKSHNIRLITGDVIYRIIDDYALYREEAKKMDEKDSLKGFTSPCKFSILTGYIFRQNNPAIVGCSIDKGVLKTGTRIMKDGKRIGLVKSIQQDKESVSEAKAGSRVAVSIEGATVGRQIFEGDILYSDVSEAEYREYKKNKDALTGEEKELLQEIAAIQRQDNDLWGV